MGKIDGSKALAASGSTDLVEFGGGVTPGIKSTDTFVASGPTTFSVTTMGTSLYSGVAQTLVATGASRSGTEKVGEVLCVLIRELVRNGTLKGTYSA